MGYRYGNRIQKTFLPCSIEEYVSDDAPVRAYNAFIDELDIEELGLVIDCCERVGSPRYDPKAMLKLFIYGYSYGVRSSRKLEREVNYNLSFIWLMGGLKPDHKTIAEFRRNNIEVIKKTLKLCVRLCIKLDLIDGNILFVDGTKIYANASKKRSHDKRYYEKRLVEIDERIEKILEESEVIDEREKQLGSLVKMSKEYRDSKRLKEKIENILKEFDKKPDYKEINETDTDAKIMRDKNKRFEAGYNVQAVTDDKHGLIVSVDVVSEGNDVKQFSRQIEKANEILCRDCKVACGDAGYANTADIEKIDVKNIKVIVPSQRQALHAEAKPFNKQEFRYDKEKDCYYCPEGNILRFDGRDKGKRHYLIRKAETCYECKDYGVCTKAKKGRKIVRLEKEVLREKIEAQYKEKESQEIYKRRKYRVEGVFGHIKENLQARRFLLRGKTGVRVETFLLSTGFNIVKMIKILGGVVNFIRKVKVKIPRLAVIG